MDTFINYDGVLPTLSLVLAFRFYNLKVAVLRATKLKNFTVSKKIDMNKGMNILFYYKNFS
ncbi:hypothetical protein [Aestuariivivens sediminis]|uniref:hypothetical protein n=1 Tax=Aestuariivivens sediminis TaxID=2913557 RepID=UPI001F5A73AE|nr:hypothetical protein [Aestuariivivens sediminis]